MKKLTTEVFFTIHEKLFLCTKNKQIDYFNISHVSFSSLDFQVLEIYVSDKIENIIIKIYDFDGYEKALKLLNIALELFEDFNINEVKEKLKGLNDDDQKRD